MNVIEWGERIMMNPSKSMVADWTNAPKEKVNEIVENGTLMFWNADGTAVYSVCLKEHKCDNGGVLHSYGEVKIKYTPSLDEKIESHYFPYCFEYAELIKYNKAENDPEEIIWNRFKEFVKQNESLFLKKDGGIRLTAPKGYTKDRIREMVRQAIR